MRDPENIRAVEALHPDMMGFICWEGSKRNVTQRPSYLPSCTKVGVFVNPSEEFILRMTEMLSLDAIQLHGKETPGFCKTIHDKTSLYIIKAFSIESRQDLDSVVQYEGMADQFLFDTKCKSVGGSGEQFDWSILQYYKGSTPFLLSGGIGPGDEEKVLQWQHPQFAGIDLNSRFEDSPALKNINKLRTFINKINSKTL